MYFAHPYCASHKKRHFMLGFNQLGDSTTILHCHHNHHVIEYALHYMCEYSSSTFHFPDNASEWKRDPKIIDFLPLELYSAYLLFTVGGYDNIFYLGYTRSIFFLGNQVEAVATDPLKSSDTEKNITAMINTSSRWEWNGFLVETPCLFVAISAHIYQ